MTASLEVLEDGTGTLTFGAAATFPPADDPDVGPYCDDFYFPDACPSSNEPWLRGFAYTIRDASFTDGQLSFKVQAMEPWSSWCELQTPYEVPDASVDGTGGGSGIATDKDRTCVFQPYPFENLGNCTIGTETVDCAWLSLLMMGTCICTSSQCFSTAETGGANRMVTVSLVVADDQESLTGWLGGDDLQLTR